jgi:hypothetical protein
MMKIPEQLLNHETNQLEDPGAVTYAKKTNQLEDPGAVTYAKDKPT